MRHACSTGGFGEKNSHIREETVVLFEVRAQCTSRLWMPCCAVTQSAVLGASANSLLASRETSAQLPQFDISHSKRSWCQSHTLKQRRSTSGFPACRQWLWWAVQPSMWTHHAVLVWTPAVPHSSPMHWPHWPARTIKKTKNLQLTFFPNFHSHPHVYVNDIWKLLKILNAC